MREAEKERRERAEPGPGGWAPCFPPPAVLCLHTQKFWTISQLPFQSPLRRGQIPSWLLSLHPAGAVAIMGKSEPLARAVGYLSAGLQLQCKQQPRVMPVKSVCSGRIARIKPNRTPHSGGGWGVGGLQSAPPALFAFTWAFQSRRVGASLSVCSVLGNVYAIVGPSRADPVRDLVPFIGPGCPRVQGGTPPSLPAGRRDGAGEWR